ncbi:MAG: FadR family transcriptional regulator [Gammaproteobacteria bacterium]|nr:FadR family transcriptional regulator [Gammaproteobacteria bacterium]
MSSPNSVSHEIADVLRSEILRGQYRAGERLPSERDLSSRFDVSRGAVREALSQLEQQGITETQPGGVRVRKIEQATLAILGPMLTLQEVPDPELVDQFLKIFSMLTSLTVKGAVGHANDEQMDQLNQLLKELGQETDNFESMQPRWQSMLDYMASIDNNLVVRLIGNDVKAQFVGHMLKLEIKPCLKTGVGVDFVKALETAFKRKNGVLAATAFENYFDQMRAAMREALENIQPVYQKRVV